MPEYCMAALSTQSVNPQFAKAFAGISVAWELLSTESNPRRPRAVLKDESQKEPRRSNGLASIRGPVHPMLEPHLDDPLCRLSRERALRFAILMDAIRCLAGSPGGRSRDRLVLARRAEIWVRRRDTRWPFSFDNVCDALNIDAERMRTYLLNPTSGLVTQRQPPRVASHPAAVARANGANGSNGRQSGDA